MTSTASKPVVPPRARPPRLGQQRLTQQRARQQRLLQASLGLPPLLEDKLRAPRLTLTMLRRRRVTEAIDAAVRHRVTLVSGSAGTGKTVACAAWAAARPAARQPAWLTVDSLDREPGRFWPYVVAALAQTGALTAEDAGRLQTAPPADCPLRIAAAVRDLPEPVVLVMDDVHELAASPTLAGLDLLIRHAPASLRLVLSGRGVPSLALARLRVAGELAEVGAADLACAAQEADAYLSLLGLRVTPAQRDELLARTEGWMAGIRLAAMGLQPGAGQPGGESGGAGRGVGAGQGVGPGQGGGAGTEAAAGTEAVVIDYVRDEVLGQLSPEIGEFLLRTSVVPAVGGDLADALTDGSGTASRTLDQLARDNSLVTPVGPGRREYRYHPMLREVLGVELRRQHPQEVPALLARAARWHAGRGQVLEAIRAAAQAEDWDFAAHVLAEAGPAALAVAGPAELTAVLDAFPPDRRAGDAPIAAALAAARLWLGDVAGAAPHLACARGSLERLDEAARRCVEPWLAALLVLADENGSDAGPDADLRDVWTRAQEAAQRASSVPEYRAAGALWFALGCARLRHWEPDAARQALALACSQLAAGSLPGLRARALAWQALAAARSGELAAADAMLGEVTAGPPAWRADVACPLALAQAQVSLARDELDTARARLDDAVRCAGRRLAGEPDVAAVSGVIAAHCAMAESDWAGAHSAILRLRAGHAAGRPALAAVLSCLEASIALAAGDRDQASVLLGPEPGTAGESGPGPAERGAVAVSRGRLLLAIGDDKGALEIARRCQPDSSQAGWPREGAEVTTRDRVAALLVAAVAERRLGQITEAAESIEQALTLAEPGGACRVFLDGGSAVRSAMTVLVPPTSRCARFAARILERFDGQLPRPVATDQSDLPLTSSELAVLRFLPSHMTNQEIAEALFLSINTVKTHLRSAYRKLGVSSRRQAIARGRRLDLL